MRKVFLLFALFSIVNNTLGQICGIVINDSTKESIPYVNIWVENEENGTSSDINGNFCLNKVSGNKTIIFSAIGFETKKIAASKIGGKVNLEPQIFKLKEVVVSSMEKKRKMVIGRIKKEQVRFYYSCNGHPWIIAKFFPYMAEYHSTPYLKNIVFLTKNEINEAKFNVRLLKPGPNGEPSIPVYNRNIIGVCKKGDKKTLVDISDLHIEFPENGFFVAVEWLVIESNKHEFQYSLNKGSKTKLDAISYEPSFGNEATELEDGWIFNMGKWRKEEKSKKNFIHKSLKRYSNSYKSLAIELTLSN